MIAFRLKYKYLAGDDDTETTHSTAEIYTSSPVAALHTAEVYLLDEIGAFLDFGTHPGQSDSFIITRRTEPNLHYHVETRGGSAQFDIWLEETTE